MQDKLKDFRARLKKYIPIIKDAKEKNLNEADTRMRIRVLLSEVLGYDMLEEITQEHMVQGHYVDLTVKAPMWDKKANKYQPTIIFFIEAKSVETVLRDTHAYQAINYAASGGVSLCLLTNAIDYRLYHLTWDKAKVESSVIISFNILNDDIDILAEKLYLLTKDSFKKGYIDNHIRERTSLGDKNIIQALFSNRVLTAIRLELKNITGHNVKDEAIEKSLTKFFDPKLYEIAKACVKKQEKKTSKPVEQAIGLINSENVITLDERKIAEGGQNKTV